MNKNDWNSKLMFASWSLERTKAHLENICYKSNANATHRDICNIALTSIEDILSDYEKGFFDYIGEIVECETE